MKIVEIIFTTIIISGVVGLLTYTELIQFEKVFRIKWEIIINIILGIITLIAWSMIEKNDFRTVIVAIIPTILLISCLVNYEKIKEVREFLLRTW